MEDFLGRAVDAAIAGGAAYADARAVHGVTESLTVRGPVVETVDRSDSLGFGVRVIADGAWGFAASWRIDDAEASAVARTAVEVARAGAAASAAPVELVPEPAHRDSYATPVEIDGFTVPLEDKVALLAAAAEEIERNPGIRLGRGTLDLVRQKTWFVSSEGAVIDQDVVHTGAGIEATAVSDGEVQLRSYPGSFRGHLGAGGYELVQEMDLPDNAARIADEAVALLRAPECPEAVTTLVLDGHQVMLQVHESIGHATELDRVIGMEASFAGTSFLDVGDLGGYRFGSELVNVTADATVPGGIGTFGYDDEGVVAQRADLIRDGLLVGYQTSRETAARIGADKSNGTMRAEGWENFPLIRMTNVNLLPGEGTLEDLLADVDSGVFMATNKSWSIDDKRKNFQFGCEIAWEIKKGRLVQMLKNPRYTGITPAFWASCDAVAGPSEWRVWGTPNCGKGQPGQTVRVGHGTSPARFRDVATGVAQ